MNVRNSVAILTILICSVASPKMAAPLSAERPSGDPAGESISDLPDQAELLHSMADLDRLYFLPALSRTEARDTLRAAAAIDSLSRGFRAYRETLPPGPRNDPRTAAGLDSIAAGIARARILTAIGGDLDRAAGVLRAARLRLAELREGGGTSFFPDLVISSGRPIESIAQAAGPEGSPLPDSAAIRAIRSSRDEARRRWERVVAAADRGGRLVPSESDSLGPAVSRVSAALSRLSSALDRNDRPEIGAAARAILPAYRRVLGLIGFAEPERPRPLPPHRGTAPPRR